MKSESEWFCTNCNPAGSIDYRGVWLPASGGRAIPKKPGLGKPVRKLAFQKSGLAGGLVNHPAISNYFCKPGMGFQKNVRGHGATKKEKEEIKKRKLALVAGNQKADTVYPPFLFYKFFDFFIKQWIGKERRAEMAASFI